ncbi:nitrogen regulatory IIA protein [Flavobacterium sp. FlaQc-48]|uniref:nitrogen regulatory IIA protein n=1 Tax=Flavobacterium sp. FlaQc-48 TaxID=3374181 RepID=UPI003757CA49
MKNVRNAIDKWLEQLDKRWDEMPIQKQHRFIRYFFSAYLLLTALIIFNVWRDTARSENQMVIGHIENPVRPKKEAPAALPDSLKSILKDKTYEKK